MSAQPVEPDEWTPLAMVAEFGYELVGDREPEVNPVDPTLTMTSRRRHARWDEPCCDAEDDGWHCTLPVGHEGQHEAGTGPVGDLWVVAAAW
jgi:hypothetical protein